LKGEILRQSGTKEHGKDHNEHIEEMNKANTD